MRPLLIVALTLVAAGCLAFGTGVRFDEVERSPDWWRAVATAEQTRRVAEAEAMEARQRAWSDSLGEEWPWPPLERGHFLDYQQLEDPRAAFALLLNTQTFASSHVSVSGEPSRQYVAFNTLLRRRDADRAFVELLERAAPAGQLYALSGLYLTDRARFAAEVGRYTTSADSVWTLWGCVAGREPVAGIAADITSGEWPEGLRMR